MDVDASLTCAAPRAAVYEVVRDLGRYPEWLEIVGAAEPVDCVEGDPGPAWRVDLRAQVGPLRRTKRLRMVRVVADEPAAVRFERRELDGKKHSPWVLEATIEPDDPDGDESSTLHMHLHYGGGLWLPVLDRLLRDEIHRGRARLTALLEAA